MNKPAIVGLIITLGIALGITLSLVAPDAAQQKTIDLQTIEWLDNPRRTASFKLETVTGDFDNQSLLGHWSIVLFGFLHCPDICPTSLAQLATLAGAINDHPAGRPNGNEVNFVFVSVDPGRDSVAEVDEYAQHFDSTIRGVTGAEEQLKKFAKSLGVQFKVSPTEGNYDVAHSVTFSIIDSDGVLQGRFRPGFDVANLVRDLHYRRSL